MTTPDKDPCAPSLPGVAQTKGCTTVRTVTVLLLLTGSVLVDETAALFERVIGVAGVVPLIVIVMGTESGYATAPRVQVTVKGAVVVLTMHVPCVLDAVTLLKALVWLGAVPIAGKVSVIVTPAPAAKPRLLT